MAIEETFNAEFLTGILSSEETSVEDKVTQIISGYNASVNGLKTNRDKWQTEVAEQKKQLAEYVNGKAEYEKQIADLTEQINSKANNKDKEFYDSQLKLKDETFAKEKAGLLEQISTLTNYKLDIIKRNAISKGVEGIKFVDENLKQAFIQLVLARENFKPQVVGEETKFLLDNGKELSDVLKEYAISEIGKSFIANGNVGGGGGNKSSVTTPVQKNPFMKETENLDLQMKLYRENPALAKQLAKEAGIDL